MELRQRSRVVRRKAQPQEPPHAAGVHVGLKPLHALESARDGRRLEGARADEHERVEHLGVESGSLAQRLVSLFDGAVA